MHLQPNYIVDENNQKIAVQFNMQDYQKINETFENYALAHFINNIDNDNLTKDDAKDFYKSLKNS
jgi:hypothetical protein